MNCQIQEIVFKAPVHVSVNSDRSVPAAVHTLAAPDAVSVKSDRRFPDVSERLIPEKAVLAVCCQDDEELLVPEVLKISNARPFAPGALPLGNVNAVALDQLGVHGGWIFGRLD